MESSPGGGFVFLKGSFLTFLIVLSIINFLGERISLKYDKNIQKLVYDD